MGWGKRKSDNQAYLKNRKTSKLSKTGSLSATSGILLKFIHKRYPNDIVLKTKGLPVRLHYYDTERGDYIEGRLILGNNPHVDLQGMRRDAKDLVQKIAVDKAKLRLIEGDGDVYLLGRDIDDEESRLLSATMAVFRHDKDEGFTKKQLKFLADIPDRYFDGLMKLIESYGWAERTDNKKWTYLGHGIDFKQVPKSEFPQVFK